MKPVNVGMLGLGTVGSGVVNILERNADVINRRAGREIRVTHASARHPERPRSCRLEGIRLTTDPFEVVDDPEVEIIAELIGGYEPARELVLRALDNGKHVITANKALIASHGNEIFARARQNGVTVAFEAAVAGGIPIIKAVREALTGNRVEWLAGIINGTSNYILTEMFYEGRDFGDVLAEAQRRGYAEADPSFEVDGTDAAHKLTILASIASASRCSSTRCTSRASTTSPAKMSPLPRSWVFASSTWAWRSMRRTGTPCVCTRPCCPAGTCWPMWMG